MAAAGSGAARRASRRGLDGHRRGEEEAIFATHRPGGWDAEQRYVVVRRRAVQFTALPKRTRKHGLRPVIRHVMRTAAYMVRTARRLFVRFAKTNFHLDWLYEAMARLEARAPPPASAA